MKKHPKNRQPLEFEPELLETEETEESPLANDDEMLDSFLEEDYDSDSDDDSDYDFGASSYSDMDSDAEFDRYFRNQESHRGRQRRRRRRERSWEESFDFGPMDDWRGDQSRSRRPRR